MGKSTKAEIREAMKRSRDPRGRAKFVGFVCKDDTTSSEEEGSSPCRVRPRKCLNFESDSGGEHSNSDLSRRLRKGKSVGRSEWLSESDEIPTESDEVSEETDATEEQSSKI